MKKICTVLAALAILVATSCSNSTKEATSVANDFLSAYFSTDYESALRCCTQDLNEALSVAIQEYYELEEEVQEEIVDISSNVQTAITSVQNISKDSIKVCYDVIMPAPDPTIHNTLIVVRTEGEWRVAEI